MIMMESKKWYESKTVWSTLAIVLVMAFNILWIKLTEAELVWWFEEWVTIALALIALYWRVTAKTILQ